MSLDQKIAALDACLADIAAKHQPATLANSLGAEDMVLLDSIDRGSHALESFMLDTGRLHHETYSLLKTARARYRTPIHIYCPDTQALETLLMEDGPNAFYDSVEQRKRCCGVRKIQSLKRALQGKSAWITGLRREQSPTRTDMAVQEHDAGNGLEKFNPLLEWCEQDVWDYIKRFKVPYNALHDQGFPSIGCAPCTRAVAAGEDVRAGRWWWESPEQKECGLHPAGKK